MAIPQFADISAFQPENIDWKTYRAWAASFDSVARISMKSTEGVGFTDPHFHEYRDGALAANVDRCIYYHFARPDLGNSPEAEADYMHSIVGSVRDGDILMLDYEVTKPQATADWAYRWLARQEANYGGKLPTIYASSYYVQEHLQDARLSRYPLTLANWTYNPTARPACPNPWKAYTYLQFTDKDRTIPGIPGTVDANVFLGSEEEFVIIDINTPGISEHFTQSDENHWTSKATGKVLQYAMLSNYKQEGNKGLCGWDELGDVQSNEIELPAPYPKNSVVQFYEFGVRMWNAATGKVTPVPLYDGGIGQDPLINQLKAQIAQLQAQSSDPTDAAKLAQIKAIVG